MGQTQASNLHNVTEAPDALTARERRHPMQSPSVTPVTPERLIARHVEDARRDLAVGRERLKDARRRVVQLEEALVNWERLAGELHRGRKFTPPT